MHTANKMLYTCIQAGTTAWHRRIATPSLTHLLDSSQSLELAGVDDLHQQARDLDGSVNWVFKHLLGAEGCKQ